MEKIGCRAKVKDNKPVGYQQNGRPIGCCPHPVHCLHCRYLNNTPRSICSRGPNPDLLNPPRLGINGFF